MTEGNLLSEDRPFTAAESRRQVAGVLRLLGSRRRRVLELGCGAGRVLRAVAAAGHRCHGIDRDASRLARCAAPSPGSPPIVVAQQDVRSPWRGLHGIRFDAVLLLGNTLMEFAEPGEARRLVRRACARLVPGGRLVIDDLPSSFWPLVASGDWCAGIDGRGEVQMAWSATDETFTLRSGAEVDPARPHPGPGERLFRLWTDGSLRLLVDGLPFGPPQRDAGSNLLWWTRLPA